VAIASLYDLMRCDVDKLKAPAYNTKTHWLSFRSGFVEESLRESEFRTTSEEREHEWSH
jgi:hypothetical protein